MSTSWTRSGRAILRARSLSWLPASGPDQSLVALELEARARENRGAHARATGELQDPKAAAYREAAYRLLCYRVVEIPSLLEGIVFPRAIPHTSARAVPKAQAHREPELAKLRREAVEIGARTGTLASP